MFFAYFWCLGEKIQNDAASPDDELESTTMIEENEQVETPVQGTFLI